MLITKIHQFLLGVVCITLLSACAGSTVVDFKVQLDVSYSDVDGQPLAGSPAQVTESDRGPARLSPYPLLHYRDSMLSWYLSVSTYGITFSYLENLSALPLTIHWDQALATSSQHLEALPLRASLLMPNYRGNRLAPQLVIPGGEPVGARIGLHYYGNELFESRWLFDVQFADRKTRLDKTGVGEWLLLTLPIDFGDERLMMHIKLTALDASARISYF